MADPETTDPGRARSIGRDAPAPTLASLLIALCFAVIASTADDAGQAAVLIIAAWYIGWCAGFVSGNRDRT